MPKTIYVAYLSEQPSSNPHYLNRLVKLLNHFISVEPPKRTKGFECHHIVPRSWKPEWIKEPDNLLKVPTKAHYVIHHLMWKAFPGNEEMAYAFHQMRYRLKQKVTSKVFEILKQQFSEMMTKNNLKRVANGTNPFSGSKLNNKKVADGTHNFLGGEFQRKRIADGTHNFLDREFARKNVIKRLANGTHPSQIKKTCPYCGIICSSGMYGRYHGEKCKLKV